jgi:hypothetical protein
MTLFGSVAAAITAALLTGDDEETRTRRRRFLRLLPGTGIGAVLGVIAFVIATNLNTPGPISALSYVQAIGGSDHDVQNLGTATFAVAVPSRYDKLTIGFSAVNSPGFPPDLCIDGSQVDITPKYGASLGQVQDIGTGTMSSPIEIPPGISSFTLSVEFISQVGYQYCHEDISVAAAHFGT